MATRLDDDLLCQCHTEAYYWSAHNVASIDPDSGRPYHRRYNATAKRMNGTWIRPCGCFFDFNEQQMEALLKWMPQPTQAYLDWLPD